MFQGAEAIVTIDAVRGLVTKTRIPKRYRIKEIDESLRKKRTRREASLLGKMAGIAPKVISVEKYSLEMEYVQGDIVRDILGGDPGVAGQIAKAVSRMHNKNIVHGDLTTSNILLDSEKQIRIIDFGLGATSMRIEDKAVDIHVFKQALIAKHHEVFDASWNAFLESYDADDKEKVLKRLKEIEKRGRYR